MSVAPYGEKLVPFLESIGAVEARRLKLQNHFHSEDWQALERWLAIEDVESKARSEKRSLWAFRISIIAAILSASAISISNFEKISQFISWLSRLYP